ncbi:MAG: B12-binding domain-containing radical SAM protein [Promethearchaeota archaeon]
MKNINILYVHPQEAHGKLDFLSNLLRISNYLNSRKSELKGKIQELYLDLRFENLPRFIPKNIVEYRKALKQLLEKIQSDFHFNLAAIACYSQFKYLNTVEIASIIKKYINPECIIVVGGPCPTLLPQDFQPGNLPNYIEKEYGKRISPFDFLIKNEGEIPFFKLIKNIMNNSIEYRENLMETCKILESEIIQNLDETPIIDFSLYKKYSDIINEYGQINIDFSRGCPFNCKICTNSTDLMPCYKKVRFKSIKRCIEELKALRDIKWFKFNTLYITDMIFLPRKSYRKEFYQKFKEFKNEQNGFPQQIIINERIDVCSEFDMKNYKDLNIVPQFGFESASKIILKQMGKVIAKDNLDEMKKIDNYLKKAKEIIHIANDIQLIVIFNYILSSPGSNFQTFKEITNFFLKKQFNGLSLVEKYDVNLFFSKYSGLYGSKIYDEIESIYGGKIYYKNWWKIFHENQRALSALIEPSKDLTLIQSLKLDEVFIKEVFKKQYARKNNFYNPAKLLRLNYEYKILLEILKEFKD